MRQSKVEERSLKANTPPKKTLLRGFLRRSGICASMNLRFVNGWGRYRVVVATASTYGGKAAVNLNSANCID
jgi:hypothetical protein